MKPYIYIRTLKHAEHTVFCVQEGQKAYFDPLFNRMPLRPVTTVKGDILFIPFEASQ